MWESIHSMHGCGVMFVTSWTSTLLYLGSLLVSYQPGRSNFDNSLRWPLGVRVLICYSQTMIMDIASRCPQIIWCLLSQVKCFESLGQKNWAELRYGEFAKCTGCRWAHTQLRCCEWEASEASRDYLTWNSRMTHIEMVGLWASVALWSLGLSVSICVSICGVMQLIDIWTCYEIIMWRCKFIQHIFKEFAWSCWVM